MLDITNNKLHHTGDLKGLSTMQRTALPHFHLSFRNLLLILLAVVFGFMLLPWTQNIQAAGRLTTLRPEQRPQTIHSTIAGRVEKWYVMEGQMVKKGDTIATLSEIKSEYLDPQLVARMGNQVEAKESAVTSYSDKAAALVSQMDAMEREIANKKDQLENKIRQNRLKITSDSIAVQQAQNDVNIARRQLEGVKVLYEKGLKSLTDFEEKRLKMVETETKLVKAQNALDISRNEWNNARIELILVQNEFAGKMAKTQSERFSTLSAQYDAEASANKLKIERANYTLRQGFYVITAPQDGYIVQAVTPGIGETLKEGEAIVSILPAQAQLAVEMYVKPIDIPLLETGSTVRFMFDGWPAFFFSGWPGLSLGTYAGKVVAIDRTISANGKFRVLVAPSPEDTPWPDALRPGGGAKGIALLNDVPLWYELWRMLNGFPPDMYTEDASSSSSKEKK